MDDQSAAVGVVPNDEEILIERCRDELGDWRICVLTPFGSLVHAPWCMAVTARLRSQRGLELESMWTDDGFVIRLSEGGEMLEDADLLPSAVELKELVLRQLGSTSLFAAKFREAAGRALLLPRRRPGLRAPLWQQRKRGGGVDGGGSTLLIIPHPARNLSRMLTRGFRPCGGSTDFEEDRARADSRYIRHLGKAFALRFHFAVLLHRELHL